MTRLDLLKKEMQIIKGLKCLPFGLKDDVMESYQRECDAIEKWGAPNPNYEDESEDD